MKKRIERLQVILKNAERCNIACKYCYYFFAGDESYKDRPPLISKDIVISTANFLEQALIDIDIETIQIVFHGGEPLMQKKQNFKWACEVFKNTLADKTRLVLGVQTNGMLITDEWLDIFEEYNMNIGISLDGDEFYNDINRIDKKGNGTYHRVVKGLNKVQSLSDRNKRRAPPGVLTVINSEFNYKRIYNHFVNDLNVENIGILLPDMCHDDKFSENTSAEDYGKILIDIFELWLKNQHVYLKPLTETLEFFQETTLSDQAIQKRDEVGSFIDSGGDIVGNQIIVIQSDGELSLDDSFMVAKDWRTSVPYANVKDTSLSNYLKSPIFDEIKSYYEKLPKKCTSCNWKKLCKGGDLENRYKSGNGFDQESVFCEGLKIYYEHIIKYLYQNGYPEEKLISKLA